MKSWELKGHKKKNTWGVLIREGTLIGRSTFCLGYWIKLKVLLIYQRFIKLSHNSLDWKVHNSGILLHKEHVLCKSLIVEVKITLSWFNLDKKEDQEKSNCVGKF